MRRPLAIFLLLLAASAPRTALAAIQECSTERANADCQITIDRNYPVAMPTIQVRRGKKVTVVVANPLPFERLTLDPQSAQTVAGTDQIAGFLSSALPNLKALVGSVEQKGYAETRIAGFAPSDSPAVLKVQDDLASLRRTLTEASGKIRGFIDDATTVSLQLQEITSPLPRPAEPNSGTPERTAEVRNQHTPDPWANYEGWRKLLLCELAGGYCEPSYTSFTDILSDAAALQSQLKPLLHPAPAEGKGDEPAASPILDSADFDLKAQAALADIGALPDGQTAYLEELNRLTMWKSALMASVPYYYVAIPAIAKELGQYLVNISQARGDVPRSTPQVLGEIHYPAKGDPAQQGGCAETHLGCQVSFAVNAVNQVATFVASMPPAAQKKSIVTIAVLYADPRLEASAGVLFSMLPNSSFSNQTTVTQNPGASPTLGNVVIAQTVARPTVVPFVAANWRLLPEFAWPDRRRGAFYFTAAVGLNPNNTSAEFGLGASVSWRSVMFSPLVHWGRDNRLTQGEFVGEIWCNASGPNGAIPKCSGSPPSPSTERFWKPSFALGISVRVPSVFGGSGSSGH